MQESTAHDAHVARSSALPHPLRYQDVHARPDNDRMTDVVAGRFALCDPIARGGSGTVWRAYDRRTQQFCAAKVLRRRDAGDLLRFVREQSVRLTHPNVLTPYAWAAEDAHVVIASELVDGGSLSMLIGDYGPLAETTAAAILDQLLVALEQVHAAGLIHRDVKPANLLLRATGTGPIQVLLADFGLAMGAQDAHLTEVGTVVGTPGYLPPELMRGGGAPDVRHDLYSAGRVGAALGIGQRADDHECTGRAGDASTRSPRRHHRDADGRGAGLPSAFGAGGPRHAECVTRRRVSPQWRRRDD